MAHPTADSKSPDHGNTTTITNSDKPPAANSTAASRVFDVAELLEAILVCLPTKDLLFAQHVCKSWKAAIENSQILQQALFFRPVALRDLIAIEDEDSKFCGWKERTTGIESELFANPLLPSTMHDRMGDKYCQLPVHQSYLGRELEPLDRVVWDRPESSFRRMFVSQPAVEFVILDVEEMYLENNQPWHTGFESQIECSSGVTAGQIYDKLRGNSDMWPSMDTKLCPGRCTGFARWIHFPGQPESGSSPKLTELKDNTQLEDMRKRLKEEGQKDSRLLLDAGGDGDKIE